MGMGYRDGGRLTDLVQVFERHTARYIHFTFQFEMIYYLLSNTALIVDANQCVNTSYTQVRNVKNTV